METNAFNDEAESILNESNKVKRIHLINQINFIDLDQRQNNCNTLSMYGELLTANDFVVLDEGCDNFITSCLVNEALALDESCLNEIDDIKAKADCHDSSEFCKRLGSELDALVLQKSYSEVSSAAKTSTSKHAIQKGRSAAMHTKTDNDDQFEIHESFSEVVQKNPVSLYRPNLANWKEFSSEEMVKLCSPLSDYPEFAKVEVAIFWIAEHKLGKPLSETQSLFEKMIEYIDPLSLSDRYIGILDCYLNTWKQRIFFPPHFSPHIQNPFNVDDPKSKSKYNMHIWNLSYEDDLQELQSDSRLSFFSDCQLCNKGNQETILKLTNRSPCYEVKVENHRRKVNKPGVVYPVHFHKNTVFHWLIKYGFKWNHKILSLITHDSKAVKEVARDKGNIKVICLQLKVINRK